MLPLVPCVKPPVTPCPIPVDVPSEVPLDVPFVTELESPTVCPVLVLCDVVWDVLCDSPRDCDLLVPFYSD